MEAKDLSCWECGASLDGVPMPISRLSECLSCRAELHACRLCEFYDTRVAQNHFDDGERARRELPADYRQAVNDYAQAMKMLMTPGNRPR